ncbi:hypothetical protein CXB51_026260 [Gossypium anomalum]|uniref:DUF7745 domain-containing protein n=1 Tax=Gossypium anomalum TaxID=47600 RepID=A0A8J5YB19_9ROSI|nr:hypothetical protein CXB51_026260 [Gossypium anomalum]
MENGLLDRVEGNANVHRWFEQTQLRKRDSITVGYMSELSNYTRVNVTQNNLQELKAIWDQWGNETKQSFYGKYRDLPYLFDIQVDENLFRALAQFWNPAYSCFTFGEVYLVPTVEEYTALLRCPRFQCDRIYSRAACIPTFGKKLMTITGMSEQWIMARIKEKGESKCIPKCFTSIPAILAETFRSLNACRRASAGRFVGCAQLLLAWFYSHFRLIDRVVCRVFFEDYSPLKDIAASTRRVNVPEKNWITLLQKLQSKDVEWRAPWMIPGEILYRCGSFDWVPLLGIWGAIGYAPLLVLRQHGLRQFILTTYGLVQSEFVYRGADYRGKSAKLGKSSTDGGIFVSDASELEIMKQEFERKNLELEKRTAKLKEEKIYLSLDVDVQKKEVKKERKEKKKIEEDRDDLKEHYKKAQISLKRARIGGSSDQLQKEATELGRSLHLQRSRDSTVEVKKLKGKVEELESALQDGKLFIEQLEAREDYLKGKLCQSKEQFRDRDYLIGEAIIQIREVAKHVRDLAVRADVLSMIHESSSDVGRELALLLDRVKTLGIRAKVYL